MNDTRSPAMASEVTLHEVAERHGIELLFHRLTDSGSPPPSDYHDSFVQLAKLGVLESGFARRIAAAAGLRSRIAHEYDVIDHAKVHEAVAVVVTDVPVYVGAVQEFIDRRGLAPR